MDQLDDVLVDDLLVFVQLSRDFLARLQPRRGVEVIHHLQLELAVNLLAQVVLREARRLEHKRQKIQRKHIVQVAELGRLPRGELQTGVRIHVFLIHRCRCFQLRCGCLLVFTFSESL